MYCIMLSKHTFYTRVRMVRVGKVRGRGRVKISIILSNVRIFAYDVNSHRV
jgi:hypothetical protein